MNQDKIILSTLLLTCTAIFFYNSGTEEHRAKCVAIIGTGYVGLVAGGGLASLGHQVICIDNDASKIASLNNGIMPIYEPGLGQLISDMTSTGRLSFSTDIAYAIDAADIVMIAVGTPMGEDGSANLRALMNVLSSIKLHMKKYTVICTKSTVPVGTNAMIKEMLQEGDFQSFDVVFNPEFLREGSALHDFFNNNPVIVGSDSQQALNIMQELYEPMIQAGTKFITTTIPAAETIKYAWNAYSAIKISYVNQLAHFCNAVGADIKAVVQGMSFSDELLPMRVIKPGPGIGGSCLPKDTKALISMSNAKNIDMSIVRTAMEWNNHHTQLIIDKLYTLIDKDSHPTIGILGLSFKPNTDDIRYSPAITVIERLLQENVTIKAYDPQANSAMKKLFPQVIYSASADEALQDADAVIMITDWDEFKEITPATLATLVRKKIVIDTRNLWSPKELRENGFIFYNLGRQ